MKTALLALLLLIAPATALAEEGGQPTPAVIEIAYGDHVFSVPADQPLVSCIVAQKSDLDGRWVELATWIRNERGVYDLIGEKWTRQTGPTESYGVGTCLFLEGTDA
jgi:hypothetical protein